jgi:hypothetical protein
VEFLLIKPQAMGWPVVSFWPLAIKIKDRPRMLSPRGPVNLDPKIINCDLTEPFSSAVTVPRLPISCLSTASLCKLWVVWSNGCPMLPFKGSRQSPNRVNSQPVGVKWCQVCQINASF